MEMFENFTEISINNTATEQEPPTVIRHVFQVLVVASMLIMMFAMGCEIRYEEVIKHLRKPVSIVVGLLSQFLIMPLMGFVATKILGIGGNHAISILILSCCPGGGYSNFLSYISKGDVPLSVTLTTLSNLLAFGMTPLNVWIYSHGLESENKISFPFKEMVLAMFSLTTILAGGIFTRWKKPNAAPIITKAGVIFSVLLAAAGGVLAIIMYSNYLRLIPLFLFKAIAIVASLGMFLAFCSAWACKLSWRIRRTIAIESTVQNIGTAITICILSFSANKLKELSMYIILYGGVTIFTLVIAAGIYAAVRYCTGNTEEENIIKEEPLENESYSAPNIIVNHEY